MLSIVEAQTSFDCSAGASGVQDEMQFVYYNLPHE
jgi:hypothetical protein